MSCPALARSAGRRRRADAHRPAGGSDVGRVRDGLDRGEGELVPVVSRRGGSPVRALGGRAQSGGAGRDRGPVHADGPAARATLSPRRRHRGSRADRGDRAAEGDRSLRSRARAGVRLVRVSDHPGRAETLPARPRLVGPAAARRTGARRARRARRERAAGRARALAHGDRDRRTRRVHRRTGPGGHACRDGTPRALARWTPARRRGTGHGGRDRGGRLRRRRRRDAAREPDAHPHAARTADAEPSLPGRPHASPDRRDRRRLTNACLTDHPQSDRKADRSQHRRPRVSDRRAARRNAADGD